MLALALYSAASKTTRWLAKLARVPSDAHVRMYLGAWRQDGTMIRYTDDGSAMLRYDHVRRGALFTVASERPTNPHVPASVHVLLSARDET